MSEDKSAPELPPGFLIWPSVKGHSPPRSLNRLLLPDPLGPVTRMLLPGETCAQCQHASLQLGVQCPQGTSLPLLITGPFGWIAVCAGLHSNSVIIIGSITASITQFMQQRGKRRMGEGTEGRDEGGEKNGATKEGNMGRKEGSDLPGR